MMEAVRISETSVCVNKTTKLYVPESCRLHQYSVSGVGC
jgi:hypothetical protein